MASVKEAGLVREGVESLELARLRRELDEARTRLEEETAYFRAELEATRQRVEKQTVREHAEEVAKRRRAEEQILALRAELRQVRSEAEAARERAEDLERTLARQEEESRLRVQQEVEKVRSAATAAWQSAEEEIGRAEEEHAATRQLLAQTQARVDELEALVASLRSRRQAAEGPDPDTLKLVGSLKKALWATAQARRRAEVQLAVLKAGGTLPPAETAAAEPVAPAQPQPPPQAGGGWVGNGGLYNELSLDTLKSLKFGDMNDELAEGFLLVPGDASLDADTFETLKTLPDPEPVPPPVPPSRKPEIQKPPQRPALAQVRSEPVPAYEVEGAQQEPRWVDRSRNGLGRVMRNLLIGGAMTGLGYWLIDSGLLADLLK